MSTVHKGATRQTTKPPPGGIGTVQSLPSHRAHAFRSAPHPRSLPLYVLTNIKHEGTQGTEEFYNEGVATANVS